MAKRSIQGYVELASGLGELTRSRAKEAARELLTLSGADASSKKVAKEASRLAEELLTAAETNRKQLVRLVRREVETAMARLDVSRVVGDVQHLGATVTSLAGQVDELARAASGRGTFGSSPTSSDAVAAPVQLVRDTASTSGDVASNSTARKASTRSATARKSPAKRSPAKRTAGQGATSGTAARKTTAKKATAKTTAKTTTAKKATANTTARKTTATTTARKTTPAASGTARKAPAKKAPAKRAPARKSSPSTQADVGGTSSSAPAAGSGSSGS